MASAVVEETFPKDVGIYNLPEFLGVLSMFSNPDVDIDSATKFVRVSEGKRSVKYVFADPRVLQNSPRNLVFPNSDISFALSNADLNAIRKASSTLSLPHLVIRGVEGKPVSLVVTDVEDMSSNAYEVELDDSMIADTDFNMVFTISNFKFLPDDYVVNISSKLISCFRSPNRSLEYFVAVEKSSSFGG